MKAAHKKPKEGHRTRTDPHDCYRDPGKDYLKDKLVIKNVTGSLEKACKLIEKWVEYIDKETDGEMRVALKTIAKDGLKWIKG